MQHFLTLDDLGGNDQIHSLLERAVTLKRETRSGVFSHPLQNKSLALLFAQPSTRTRVSFEVAMAQLGGNTLVLNSQDTQLGRGESIVDTARVLSSMVDAVMIRTHSHQDMRDFASASSVPVINGLSRHCHPCQLLADLQTIAEIRGDLNNLSVAWLGDGNNVCHSWINAARLLDISLRIATPVQFSPDADVLAKGNAEWREDAQWAVEGADVVITDTWASMGDQPQQNQDAFNPYQVNSHLMGLALPEAIFLHCLPAYRGKEVSSAIIDGPQSAVFQAAENRMHAQKALLERLLSTG